MQYKHTRRGFTLIELLVVVLIIGILAAVAVPQYQKAVLKSRMITDIALLKNIIYADRAYYLTHGEYAIHFKDLDVQLTCRDTNSTIEKDSEYCYLNGIRTVGSHIAKLYVKAGIYIRNEGQYVLDYEFRDGMLRCCSKNNNLANSLCQELTNTTDFTMGSNGVCYQKKYL